MMRSFGPFGRVLLLASGFPVSWVTCPRRLPHTSKPPSPVGCHRRDLSLLNIKKQTAGPLHRGGIYLLIWGHPQPACTHPVLVIGHLQLPPHHQGRTAGSKELLLGLTGIAARI